MDNYPNPAPETLRGKHDQIAPKTAAPQQFRGSAGQAGQAPTTPVKPRNSCPATPGATLPFTPLDSGAPPRPLSIERGGHHGAGAKHTCDTCKQPVIHTYDDPEALALPVTINREPTTPTAALAAIINGRTVVYASRYKRDRGAGVGTDFHLWRPAQFTVNFTKPLHVEHACGEDYPPAEPDDTVTRMWPDATTPPPF